MQSLLENLLSGIQYVASYSNKTFNVQSRTQERAETISTEKLSEIF